MWHPCNLAAKDSGLEHTCVNNDDFTVLDSGGSRHCSVSMCTCVVITFKMTEWATNLHQTLCSACTFLCGNYSDDSEGRSCGQLVIGSFITITCPLMYHILCSFWCNIKSPRWLSLPTTQIWSPTTSGFPQN